MDDDLMKFGHNPFKSKIKFFSCTSLDNLEKVMNDFLENLPCEIQVKDVKLFPNYTIAHVGMIIYV
jgi:hypothetical protein